MEHVGSDLSILEEIGNLSKEGLIIYSLEDHKVRYANAMATELTGLRENTLQEEVVSVINYLDLAEVEFLKIRYRELIEKSHVRVQIELPDPTGQSVVISCSAYLLSDSSVIVAILQNITGEHEHQEYLLKFTAKKNTLLDTLVHHISGALSLMQNLSTEAEKYVNASGDDNLKTYLSLVKANSVHCLKIINDLVSTENREAPTIAIQKVRTDIVKQVAHVVEELKLSYPNRAVAFYSTATTLPILTDEVKLMLAINNLLSNALKYSRDQDSIIVRVIENDQDVTISVIDNGIGIPESLKGLIFERQPETGRMGLQGEKSSGLGLFISKNLIERIGGKIRFESREGFGSTFSITLPKT